MREGALHGCAGTFTAWGARRGRDADSGGVDFRMRGMRGGRVAPDRLKAGHAQNSGLLKVYFLWLMIPIVIRNGEEHSRRVS